MTLCHQVLEFDFGSDRFPIEKECIHVSVNFYSLTNTSNWRFEGQLWYSPDNTPTLNINPIPLSADSYCSSVWKCAHLSKLIATCTTFWKPAKYQTVYGALYGWQCLQESSPRMFNQGSFDIGSGSSSRIWCHEMVIEKNEKPAVTGNQTRDTWLVQPVCLATTTRQPSALTIFYIISATYM